MKVLTLGMTDNEKGFAAFFKYHLPSRNILCIHAEDVEDALSLLRMQKTYCWDMFLTYSNDPFETIPREIRRAKIDVPIIVYTGIDNPAFRVKLLNQGADRIQECPVDTYEAISFIEALDRRCKNIASPLMEFGELTINLHSQDVFAKGQPVRLTQSEFKVLQCYAMRRGIVTCDEVHEFLYGDDAGKNLKIIDVYVCKINQKVRKHLGESVIRSIWGRGKYLYSLNLGASR